MTFRQFYTQNLIYILGCLIVIDAKSKDYSIREDSKFIKLLSRVFVTICKVKSNV